jgi:predicted nucleic acid-binding protein
MAVAGSADFLVTADNHDLLGLKLHESTKIVTVCGSRLTPPLYNNRCV